jgi:hypothetical protein
LKLNCDEPLSKVAFKFNLCRYNPEEKLEELRRATAAAKVGSCKMWQVGTRRLVSVLGAKMRRNCFTYCFQFPLSISVITVQKPAADVAQIRGDTHSGAIVPIFYRPAGPS